MPKKVEKPQISQKQKFTAQLHKAAKGKKLKPKLDIAKLMDKAGYSTKSQAAVNNWYDLYITAHTMFHAGVASVEEKVAEAA